MIDTHAHIYAEEYDGDGSEMIRRSVSAGVQKVVMPNVDRESLPRLKKWAVDYPDYCFPAIGLHPTSIGPDFQEELALVASEIENHNYLAVGEIGTDLYWDKTWINEQIEAFRFQLDLSLKYNLPVIIHVRDSFAETFEAMKDHKDKGLRGVFHSFTGNKEQADEIFTLGDFYIGINGIVTFKNSGLGDVVKHLPIEKIILETDAPYLTPAPHRGKRNEPAYIPLVRDKIAELFQLPADDISRITDINAEKLFNFNSYKGFGAVK